MKNVSIENSPVGQKLAASSLTRAIRSKFNLYPHDQAKGILDTCKKEGIDPVEATEYLAAQLPSMITEFLAEVRKLVSPKQSGPVTLEQLNMNVTSAIKKVEEAQGELAYAELAIAKATKPSSGEGKIARRGAIRAARAAGLDGLLDQILDSFVQENELTDEFIAELRNLAYS